jgi:DNA-binding MarR family transcriptional regulator/GNAT superfamily N-acetyltransferase
VVKTKPKSTRPDALAEAVRRFNRFYTRRIGVLSEHILDSAFSLTEVRVLYELAHRPAISMTDLGRELGLDAGYLSRVVTRFERRGLVTKRRSADDGRVAQLELTKKGRATFEPLNAAALDEIKAMLRGLSSPAQHQLVAAMTQIEGALTAAPASYVLRDPQPGDLGWVVHRHGALYADEYGWNQDFEALVAGIVADYMRDRDRDAERCWIAEQNGSVVGAVFVMRHDATTAKLRLLYVEPSARGMGIGRRLVDECIRFARRVGYTELALWTNSVLVDARKLYQAAGFRLVDEERHHSFGKDLVGQTWSLAL